MTVRFGAGGRNETADAAKKKPTLSIPSIPSIRRRPTLVFAFMMSNSHLHTYLTQELDLGLFDAQLAKAEPFAQPFQLIENQSKTKRTRPNV